MFPYNDEENAWVSKSATIENQNSAQSLTISLFFALILALISSTIPPLIYFLRTNLL